MSIHGEPGIWRDTLKSADAIADEMVMRLLAEAPADPGDRVAGGSISTSSESMDPERLRKLLFLKAH